MTALDSSILDCHFCMGGLYGKAAISSQQERSHLNCNEWSKRVICNLAFIFIFLFFYIDLTSVNLKHLFLCCLYIVSLYYVCRSADDGRSTSRGCNTSWVRFLWMHRQCFQDDWCSQMCKEKSEEVSLGSVLLWLQIYPTSHLLWMNATSSSTKSIPNSTYWSRKKEKLVSWNRPKQNACLSACGI